MIEAIGGSTATPGSSPLGGGRPSQVGGAETPPPPRAEPKPAEKPPAAEATKVSISGQAAEPNTADFNAKPVQQYKAVSALR